MEIEDKSKLFVFDKKEVVLIFIFVMVITVTAFTLGVRIGKGLSLKSAGYTNEDISKSVELKSVEEESAEKMLGTGSGDSFESSLNDELDQLKEDKAKEKLDMLGAEQKLEDEFSKAADGSLGADKKKIKNNILETVPSDVKAPIKEDSVFETGDSNIGKFTIQLLSVETKEEAEEFAEPFVAANYVVVINKASVAGKGIWYRVGVGLFNTHNEAKEYLEKEKQLFRGKKYLINQIK
jgi:hypothetical protein